MVYLNNAKDSMKQRVYHFFHQFAHETVAIKLKARAKAIVP
jgi:hypothetical protein